MKTETDLIGELQRQLSIGKDLILRPMTDAQMQESKARHPWADLVVGDFEIRVINREKYGLDPQ